MANDTRIFGKPRQQALGARLGIEIMRGGQSLSMVAKLLQTKKLGAQRRFTHIQGNRPVGPAPESFHHPLDWPEVVKSYHFAKSPEVFIRPSNGRLIILTPAS